MTWRALPQMPRPCPPPSCSPAPSSPSRWLSTSCFRPSRLDSPATSPCSKACGSRARRETYLNLYKYWLKIFSPPYSAWAWYPGLVMSYQFGSNWSVFADRAGPIIGPLMAYEVLTAFFLEAGFLGIMLFGLARVGKTLHYAATLAVAGGTLASAFWILAANSWMQTPAGFVTNADGQLLPQSWLAIIFNPSFPYRLVHMVLAAYLSTALIVGGVAAWHLLRRSRHRRGTRRMFSMAMWMAALVAPIQILAGDMHGLNTLEHQPAKIMALEGHFESSPDGAPLILFGLPDQAAGRVRARHRDSRAVLAGAQTRSACAHGRPRHHTAQRLAAGGGDLLDLPHHGGPGLCNLRARHRSLIARARGALYSKPLSAPWRAAARARRHPGRHRRLVHHRSRPAAIHHLSRAAYRLIPPRRWRRRRSLPRLPLSRWCTSPCSAPARSTFCGSCARRRTAANAADSAGRTAAQRRHRAAGAGLMSADIGSSYVWAADRGGWPSSPTSSWTASTWASASCFRCFVTNASAARS